MNHEPPLCAVCSILYEAHAEHYGIPDGSISNCATRNSAPAASCQMCRGSCPAPHRYIKQYARNSALAGYLDGFHGVPVYPLPVGCDPLQYKGAWADGEWDRRRSNPPGTSYAGVP